MRKLPKLTPSQALNRPLSRQAETSSDIFEEGIKTTRRLGFHIGDLGFLIAQQTTSELTDLLPVCPIPFTAAWLLGLINLRGNLVPVFDLHKLLQLEKRAVKKQMLLILGESNSAGAIVIDDLPIPLTFTDSEELTSLPPLPAIIKAYATTGYEKKDDDDKKGQLWFNFDHQGLFESLATKVAL
jgi:chemotaxis signal transduction protein